MFHQCSVTSACAVKLLHVGGVSPITFCLAFLCCWKRLHTDTDKLKVILSLLVTVGHIANAQAVKVLIQIGIFK